MSSPRNRSITVILTLATATTVAAGCGGQDRGAPVVALHRAADAVEPGTSLSAPRTESSGCSEGVANVVDANNAFGFELMRTIDAAGDGAADNTVLSPFSAAHAIQLLANGSLDAEVERGALDALCAAGLSMEQVNEFNRQLHRELERPGDGVDLQVANSLWTERAFTAHPEMVDVARTFYDSDLYSFDVAQAAESARRINAWAHEHTKGFIKRVIEPADIPSPDGPRVMFLVNATVFDGTWTNEFDKRDTRPWTFKVAGGTKVSHDFLHMTADLEYQRDKRLKVSTVRIPYGKDERFRMVVMLPDAKQPVEAVRDGLSNSVWDRWSEKYESTTVSFTMPKLTLRNQYDLLPLFDERFGIPEGSYGRLVEPIYEDTHVDYARQDSFLEIDEKGTKAAAVTVIGTGGVAGGVSGIPFTVDRPYLLALEDSKTGAILFTAVIRSPEDGE